METKDLSQYKFVAVIIDGKYFRNERIVYAISITNTGFKKIIGFIFTNTENAEAVKGLIKNILGRCFRYDENKFPKIVSSCIKRERRISE